jgi:hypothetical protein
MTDKEIIKILNTATNIDGLQICCIDYENDPETKTFLSIKSDIVDLINRQQAEIENADFTIEQLTKGNLQLQAEIERLTINMNAFGLGMKREKERADTIRAEAIKEFARTLRQQAFDRLYVSIDELDNLVKEMVGK